MIDDTSENAGLLPLLVLGAVQGATEFLPVSSSGHLVLLREWLGLGGGDSLAREVALHLGTLVAVVIFCWRDLLALLRAGSAGLWRLVLGSTLVTGVLGLQLEHSIESSLNDARSAGSGLLVTSLLLLVVAPARERGGRSLSQGTWRDALILGLFQSLALVPGISRAGSTIVGGLVLGFARPDAVRMAFLMSIPVVSGAVILMLGRGDGLAAMNQPGMWAAVSLAAVVGLMALRLMRAGSQPRALRMFGAYTLVLGVVAILTA